MSLVVAGRGQGVSGPVPSPGSEAGPAANNNQRRARSAGLEERGGGG